MSSVASPYTALMESKVPHDGWNPQEMSGALRSLALEGPSGTAMLAMIDYLEEHDDPRFRILKAIKIIYETPIRIDHEAFYMDYLDTVQEEFDRRAVIAGVGMIYDKVIDHLYPQHKTVFGRDHMWLAAAGFRSGSTCPLKFNGVSYPIVQLSKSETLVGDNVLRAPSRYAVLPFRNSLLNVKTWWTFGISNAVSHEGSEENNRLRQRLRELFPRGEIGIESSTSHIEVDTLINTYISIMLYTARHV